MTTEEARDLLDDLQRSSWPAPEEAIQRLEILALRPTKAKSLRTVYTFEHSQRGGKRGGGDHKSKRAKKRVKIKSAYFKRRLKE